MKKKSKGMFGKYSEKKDGVIRSYDVHSKKVKALILVIMLICMVFVVVSVFPALWVFLAGFKNIKEFRTQVSIVPTHFDFSVFKDTWVKLDFAKYYFHSFIVVAGSVVCAVMFNGLLAYGLAILKPRGHNIVFGLVMWSLLIPPTTSIVALVVNINKIGLNNSYLPICMAYGANAFYVVLFKQFFEKMQKELLEAARLDGCGVIQVFTKIILPLSRPIIMVVVIFAMTASWSDFLLPYLVLNNSGKETVMVKLYQYQAARTTDVDMIRAILFSIIPPTVLFCIFQKQITDGAAAGAVKG